MQLLNILAVTLLQRNNIHLIYAVIHIMMNKNTNVVCLQNTLFHKEPGYLCLIVTFVQTSTSLGTYSVCTTYVATISGKA